MPIQTNPDGSYVVATNNCVTSDCPGNGWQFFDPLVAIGYRYQLVPNADNKLDISIVGIQVPTKVGDGIYDLYLCEANTTNCDFNTGQHIIANEDDPTANLFDVVAYLEGLTPDQRAELGIADPEDGISEFALRGIDPSAALDPNDPVAFITGLLFEGGGDGNVLITPEVLLVSDADPTNDVPEPGSLAAFATSLLLLGWRRRRRR